ncbi:MAG: phosphoribosylamine--glycine ligase [Planctomycetota bacterium]|nr:phosphoribosylamine--glycine ligase [Planctomycetota bacterium]MDA1105013.1 phosphoribosylamine--glycine ligase [Planctomycetota bacterium]
MATPPDRVNVLLIGSGGREHAIAWRLTQSPRLGTLWVQKGANAGLVALGRECPEELTPGKAFFLTRWCDREEIGLVVIGPEGPLAEGMADVLSAPGRLVFGPRRDLALIESDKAWAKSLMREALVPTAEGRVFTSAAAALRYVNDRDEPCVVKMAGLCAGKGVTVCSTTEEARVAIRACFAGVREGDHAAKVVIEERLDGQELSVLALVDGKTITILDPCQDHKQVGEGDTGPNTGGMGAYCPTPLAPDALLDTVSRQILVPTVDALRRRVEDESAAVPFRGVLFAGLMLTPGGPKVLEYNARFGDPETQALMMRFQGDLLGLLWHTANGSLDEASFSMDSRTACCVVVCAQGYPGAPRTGDRIEGIADAEAEAGTGEVVKVFHASTKPLGPGSAGAVSAGGRVVGVTALAQSLTEAAALATRAAARIHFPGAFFRKDIGHRVLAGSAPVSS